MDAASDRILDSALNAETEAEIDDCYDQLLEHSDRIREEKGLTPLNVKGHHVLVPPSVQRLVASDGNLKCNNVSRRVFEAWKDPKEPIFDQCFVDDADCKRIRESILKQSKQRGLVNVCLFPPLLLRGQEATVLYFDTRGQIMEKQDGHPPGILIMFEDGPVIPVLRKADCNEPLVRIVCQWYDLKGEYNRISLKRIINHH